MSSCTVQSLLTASKCYANRSERELLEMSVALLCQILKAANPMASCNVDTLLASAQQFCSLDPFSLAQVNTQLLCEILHAGGGTGNSCLFCGDTDPVDAPPCDCAIAYNTTNSAFWYWDGANWIPFIGGGGQ